MLNTSIFETLPHVRSGKLRSIGITSARRVAAVPNIPTIAESGLPGYESVQWSALLAPAKTPRAIIVMKAETEKWARVAKAANIEPQ